MSTKRIAVKYTTLLNCNHNETNDLHGNYCSKELFMGYQDVAFLPSRANSSLPILH